MNIKNIENQSIEIINIWQSDLQNFSMEQLLQKPAENSWSIGQVYIHLWMAAKGFFFKNIQRIATNDEKVKIGGRKNWVGYAVFLFGAMPTIKIEMPKSISVQPNQPESKKQLNARMEEVKKLVHEAALLLPSLNPKATVKHPFLGYLTAEEWLRLSSMHFNHHTKQKQRIKKHFGF